LVPFPSESQRTQGNIPRPLGWNRTAKAVLGLGLALGYDTFHFGNSNFSHAPDTGLGGTDDVRLISGREEDEWTQIIFALPVNSGDDKDVPLTLGEKHKILLAFGPDNKDDFRTKHAFRTSFEGIF